MMMAIKKAVIAMGLGVLFVVGLILCCQDPVEVPFAPLIGLGCIGFLAFVSHRMTG